MSKTFRLKIVAAALCALLLGAMVHDFYTDPKMLRPIIGIFGRDPFGIPTIMVATAVMTLLVAPLGLMIWHGIGLFGVIHEREGRIPHGTLAMALSVRRNWMDPRVRQGAKAMMMSLAAFILVTVVWIIATARAGV